MEKPKLAKKNYKIYNKNYKNIHDNALAINVNGEEEILEDDNSLTDKYSDILNIKADSKPNSTFENNIKIKSDSGKLNEFTKKFSILIQDKDYSQMPYGQAFEFIKKIVDFKVPLEKLIIIASVSSLITECVNNYWKSMEIFIQPSMLSIDADELMTIFMYIIYKSHMPLLFVYGDFIKYFTSLSTKSTLVEYYYTTLQGYLDFLLEVKDKGEFTKESI